MSLAKRGGTPFARLIATTRIDVIPACDSPIMDQSRRLQGIELRYVLTMHLAHNGPATIPEMIDALSGQGFLVRGRPSKAISDALRWEMGRERVRRLGRGLYGPRYIPRATEYRIHQRVLAFREAAKLSLEGGQTVDRFLSRG